MHSRSILQSTSIVSILILNHLALVSAFPLQPRQSASCGNSNAAFDENCWGNLNLGDFLTNSTTGWNATLGKTCVPGDNAAYCCRSTEASWSACFMRQAVALEQKFSCASLNASNCPTSSLITVSEIAPAQQQKVRYVLHNIYCKISHFSYNSQICVKSRARELTCGTAIYNLFNIWQQALPKAISDAKPNVRDLTTEVDPKGITNLLAPDVVEAFLLGLPFLATPNATTQVAPQISESTNATAQALLLGLQHAPAVAKAIFVNASATIYPVQTVGAADFLADNYTTAQIDGRLNAGLGLIMSDLGAFVNFASSGLFSGAGNFSIPDQEGLDKVLQTLISSTVRKDHVYVNEKTGLGIGL